MHEVDATRLFLAFDVASGLRDLQVSGNHDLYATCDCMTFTLAQWVADS